MDLAGTIVRRRALIAVAWIALAAALLSSARRAADVFEVGARVEASESAEVARLLDGPLASPYARYAVLVVGGAPSPEGREGDALLRTIVAALGAAPEVAGTYSYLDARDTMFLLPPGGSFVIVGLGTVTSSSGQDAVIPALRQRTEALRARLGTGAPALRWTGEGALNYDLRESSNVDVGRAERRAFPLTAAFLLVAFGTVVAGLLPVLAGALAIVIAIGAAAGLATIWPLSIVLQSVITMLALALGIDYALLMVTRFREARDTGLSPEAAAIDATRHAGHAILLAMSTVAVGFVALLLVPLSELRAIAVGGLLAVVTSGAIATTLLPGVLAWLGPRTEWGRVRRAGWSAAATVRWRRIGLAVTARPWTALAAGGIPLLILAAQAAELRTGLPRGDWLPARMESAIALRQLQSAGRAGVVEAVRVVLLLPEGETVTTAAGWRGVLALGESFARDPRVERVRSAATLAQSTGLGVFGLALIPERAKAGLLSGDGRIAMLELMPRSGTDPDALTTLVRELRAKGAAAAGVPGATLLIGGLPAFNADYRDAVAGRFRQIGLLVVLGTFVALLVGTRSLLVPLKAMALNLLSVAAAFGALTLVFQQGYGLALFGVAEPLGMVFSTLPVIVFCVVFGLSMDYEVFLVTRVMEARRSGLDDRAAIVEGVARTGAVITNAAGVMLVVFSAFTLGELLVIKMLGFSLAVAVLLDATLVRMVIGPALLQLAGRWNWWPGDGARR